MLICHNLIASVRDDDNHKNEIKFRSKKVSCMIGFIKRAKEKSEGFAVAYFRQKRFKIY